MTHTQTHMKSFHNIDKSAFRAGEYVGYCYGLWRIIRSGAGGGSWFAYRSVAAAARPSEPYNFQSGTLAGISAALEKEAVTSR